MSALRGQEALHVSLDGCTQLVECATGGRSAGQAAGVLIDASIVRALLVPALMRLFGEWNWWSPAALKRIHRRYGFHEAREGAT